MRHILRVLAAALLLSFGAAAQSKTAKPPEPPPLVPLTNQPDLVLPLPGPALPPLDLIW